jgi:UDP-glucose 4-epimerase
VREFRENLLPTVALLERMRSHGNKRVLFLSSGGAVYGVPRSLPIPEDHPTDPISPYGVGKLAAEKYLGYCAAVHGFWPVIIRPANPYGPNQGKVGQLGAVWTFLQMIREGRTATLFGDGSAIRDFVHVDDLCALMLAALDRNAQGIFNCGGGEGVTLAGLIAVIERATGRSLAVEYKPARAFDPPAVVLDIARARNELEWSPHVSLESGIAALVQG